MSGNFLWSPIYGFSFQIWTSVRHLRCESCFFLLSKHLYQNPQAFKSRVCKHWTRLSTHSIWPSYFPVHSNHISVYWKMTFKTGANLLGSSGLGVSLLIWFWSLPIVSKGDLASWRCFLGNRDDCFQHVKKRHLCLLCNRLPPRDSMLLQRKQETLIFKYQISSPVSELRVTLENKWW